MGHSGYCIEAAIVSSETPLGEEAGLTESKVLLSWENESVANFPDRCFQGNTIVGEAGEMGDRSAFQVKL